MPTERLTIERKSATRVVAARRELIAFAGCDYLGLASHAEIAAELARAAHELGVSASASRETSGNHAAHEELEARIARFVGTEAALLAPDGYLSNLIAAQAVARRYQRALVDREAHVSLRDALAAARIDTVEYAHADGAAAACAIDEHMGEWLCVLTDGVFPALGTLAPLGELLAALPTRQTLLLVDDCHGFGVLGARGRGTCEHYGLSDPRIAISGTLSKAAGACGGFVAGSAAFVAQMRQARAYVGSTPIPPALARAATVAVDVLERDGERRARLARNVERLRAGLRELDFAVHDQPIPVFALKLASAERTARASAELRERGLLVPYVEYPDGAGSYLRLAVSSEHSSGDVERLLAELRALV